MQFVSGGALGEAECWEKLELDARHGDTQAPPILKRKENVPSLGAAGVEQPTSALVNSESPKQGDTASRVPGEMAQPHCQTHGGVFRGRR